MCGRLAVICMEGKTAAEKAAEDATAEQEAPSWAESVGAGAAWSAVKNLVGGEWCLL